jgi:hypothetical protein
VGPTAVQEVILEEPVSEPRARTGRRDLLPGQEPQQIRQAIFGQSIACSRREVVEATFSAVWLIWATTLVQTPARPGHPAPAGTISIPGLGC